jgi:hypothetical protein
VGRTISPAEFAPGKELDSRRGIPFLEFDQQLIERFDDRTAVSGEDVREELFDVKRGEPVANGVCAEQNREVLRLLMKP